MAVKPRTARLRELRRIPPPAEAKLWEAVRGRRLDGFKFRRQLLVGPYFADFACMEARLVIELDGESHTGREAYDHSRTRELERCGWKVVRFTNEQVYADLAGVIARLRQELQLARD